MFKKDPGPIYDLNYSIVLMYYQQNEKSTVINPRKSCTRSFATAATLGEMCY